MSKLGVTGSKSNLSTYLSDIPKPSSTEYSSAQMRYQQEFERMRSYVEQGIEMAKTGIAEEYQELMNTYAKSGDYEAGLRAIAEQTAKAGLGKTMGTLTQAGMSSSATATGAERGYTRDLQTAYTGIEGQRIQNYSRALELVGAAKEARVGRATNAYLSAGELMTRYNPPTPSEYADPNYGAYVGAVSDVIRGQQDITASSYGALGQYASANASRPSSSSFSSSAKPASGLSKEQLYQYENYGILPSGYSAGGSSY